MKTKKATPLEKAQARALNQSAIAEFFDVLTEVITEYNIQPENIYNMDKKGIQLGIGTKATVLIDRDQKTAYSIEDGNRELITVIEAICADGSILHPSVIFQAKRQRADWGRNNPCNARYLLNSTILAPTYYWQHFRLSEWMDRPRAGLNMAQTRL